jgi:hypothetical protein
VSRQGPAQLLKRETLVPASSSNEQSNAFSIEKCPIRRFVLGFRKLRDVGPGILERDELAAAPAASRCLSAVQVAISTKRL